MVRTRRQLDIIVPVYRNAALTKQCINSLLANMNEAAACQPRLLLVNDSPDDGEVADLLVGYERDVDMVRVLRNASNAGFVASVNRGLQLAAEDGRNALLVNSDTLTYPGTLSELLRVAQADAQIGFVSPRSNNASICSLPYRQPHSLALPPDEAHRNWTALSRTMPALHFAPTAVGFYMFVAHAVLANVGLLLPDFGLGYEEENDLVMRAGKLGYRAVIANHAFAYHSGAASFALTELDLHDHRQSNLRKLIQLHAEFLPLLKRYEESPTFRAEQLLTGLLPDAQGCLKVVFDLTGIGQHHNGTNEQTLAVVRALAERHGHRFCLTAICTPLSFEYHGLHKQSGLLREDPGVAGTHAIAIRMAQPFDLADLNRLEQSAPINVYAMLDTIAEDCGPLAIAGDFAPLWAHVSEHASGLVFISQFSQQAFCMRHPAAAHLPQFTHLLPTRLSNYAKLAPRSRATHALILGNEFAHKGANAAAKVLAAEFPKIQFVVLGSAAFEADNLTGLVPGGLEQSRIDELFVQASVVVLPSYVEGFGFGVMHALAAARPIVARRIPPTLEILATLESVAGVFLFDTDLELVPAFASALTVDASSVDDSRARGWDDWADGFAAFCIRLTHDEALFSRVVARIAHSDLLRRADAPPAVSSAQMAAPLPADGKRWSTAARVKAVSLQALLAMDGRDFVDEAYATLLQRPADNAGREFYLGQLSDGVKKVEVVRALTISAEGRARNVKLAGLNDLLIAERNLVRRLVKRVLGR